MTQRLTILGSTGSIGRQSLEVIAALGLSVEALTAHKSVKMMEEQARAVGPKLVVLSDEAAAHDLAVRMADTSVRVLGGREALLEAVTLPSADTLLTSVLGIAGLEPPQSAIDAAKTIAQANKQTLVCAGALVTAEAKKKGVKLLPVDSEHSAIFQCLQGCEDRGEVARLILTASGGPFYGMSREEIAQMTRREALKHPNWEMSSWYPREWTAAYLCMQWMTGKPSKKSWHRCH